MKKSGKRFLLVNLCLVCVFFFTACNSDNDNRKVFLAAPTGLRVNRQANAITWDAVENAKGYTVKINDTEYEEDYMYFPLKNITIDVACNIQVRAKSYKSGKKTYIKSDYCPAIICTEADAAPLNFFDICRSDRNESRTMSLIYLDEIINNADSSAETIEAACNERLRCIISMEKELVIEALIKAQGFEDCIAIFSNENLNIVVKKIDLSEDEGLTLFDIVLTELNIPKQNVRIIPVA